MIAPFNMLFISLAWGICLEKALGARAWYAGRALRQARGLTLPWLRVTLGEPQLLSGGWANDPAWCTAWLAGGMKGRAECGML